MKIIHEEKDYLIINKPSGLISHGGNGIKEKTLSDYLLEDYPELKDVGEDPNRPGIVHRLDKEASGLMIIPRNNESFKHFKNLFQKREIKKEYTALVCGKIEREEGMIDFPIKRSSQGFKMAAIPNRKTEEEAEAEEGEEKFNNREMGNIKGFEESRDAISEFKVIKKLINFSLLKVRIKTGRTHQIRVHFFAYGHPLLGDNLYKNKKSKAYNEKVRPGRIFLIADFLGFHNKEGDWQEYKIGLDPELERILEKVK